MKTISSLLLMGAVILTTARASAAEPDGYPTKRRSVPLLVTGLILGTLGTGTVIAGGVIYRDAVRSEEECQHLAAQSSFTFGGMCAASGLGKVVAIPMLIGGTTFVAAGLPMAIVGSWPVPDKSTARIPEVRVGPTSASLRWRF